MTLVRVGDLSPGQVISSAEERIGPALIEGMTAAGERQLQLRDIDSGERLEEIHRFGEDELVMLHDVVVEHHIYTNMTAEPVEVRLGPETLIIAPGTRFHHVGWPRPDVFEPDAWSCRSA
jgi:hypothetical protein